MNKKTLSIGIDIGGTKMCGILFDGEKVLSDFVLATPKDTLEHFVIMMNALIEPLEEKAEELGLKIRGIGAGIASALDSKCEKTLYAPNIQIINDVNMKLLLEKKLGRPIILDNDVNCFLRGEYVHGAAKKFDNVMAIMIGTGIGGAWFCKDGIYKGAHGSACEIGHVIIDYAENIDFETAYQKLCQNNAEHLAAEAYRGDVLAEKAYEEIGRMLGIVSANVVNVMDPEAIIVGGSVINSGDLFLSVAKKTMREFIVSSEARRVKLIKPKLGKFSGAIGAALMVE